MAITLYGVDPSITEAKWSKLFALATQTEVVTGLAVSPTATARQVSIAPGDAVAAGVLAESGATELRTLAANASGSNRIDIVAMQINWSGTQATGGTIVVVQGAASATPQPPTLTQTPGVLWQIPLARVLVRNGISGPFLASDFQTAAPEGDRLMKVYSTVPAAGQSMTFSNTVPRTIATLNVANPGWTWRPRISASVDFANTAGGFGTLDVTIDGVSVGEGARGRSVSGNSLPARVYYIGDARTGAAVLRLRMVAAGYSAANANEILEVGTGYTSFTAEIEPA